MATCSDNELGKFFRDIGTPYDYRDPGCPFVIMSGQEYYNLSTVWDAYSSGEIRKLLEAYASGDFQSSVSVGNSVDVAQAGQVFTFFFGVTVSLWFLAKSIGVVVSAIRKF
ncbi:MAG: hypothetical protein LBP58_06005 [Azoarcus sp.]|jgi:hypothetical protein|nr:hypothetical protein [Azoarcus sp.]